MRLSKHSAVNTFRKAASDVASECGHADAAFGHAHSEFMDWFGKIRVWRGLQPDGNFGADEAIASAWGAGVGAEIMGRNKFRPTQGPWPDDGWERWCDRGRGWPRRPDRRRPEHCQ
jgi:hypothetical protein